MYIFINIYLKNPVISYHIKIQDCPPIRDEFNVNINDNYIISIEDNNYPSELEEI